MHEPRMRVLRQQVPVGERVERREELPLRQVARGAEDREDARLRAPLQAQAFEERVLLRRRVLLGDGHQRGSGLACAASTARTAWPPNWLRSAALTLAANDSSCRDANRA